MQPLPCNLIYSIKYFLQVRKTPRTNILLSIAFSIFSIKLITECAVKILFWNPNCFLYRTFWSFKNPFNLLCTSFSVILSRFDSGMIGL